MSLASLSRCPRPWLALGLTCLLSLPLSADVWIVDDDGGPGVDFTDLPPAIAAAQPGDVLLVRGGSYSGFNLSKSLTIVGHHQRCKLGFVVVGQAAGPVVLADLDVQGLVLRQSPELIVLDRVRAPYSTGGTPPTKVRATNCDDVRAVGLFARGRNDFAQDALNVLGGSRFELVDGRLRAGDGKFRSSCSTPGGEGGLGVLVANSRFVAAYPDIHGGRGGKVVCLVSGGLSGDGGDGLRASGTSEVLLTGPRGLVRGGASGALVLYGYRGDGGDGVELRDTSDLRDSYVGLGGGASGSGGSSGRAFRLLDLSTRIRPTPADPALKRRGAPTRGRTLELRIDGATGATATLLIGRKAQVLPTPGVDMELLVKPTIVRPLGVIGSSRRLIEPFHVSTQWPDGQLLIAQVELVHPNGLVQRTNSLPLVLR